MTTVTSSPCLELEVSPDMLTGFASLLQHGVLFPIERPIPLLSFLVTLPGFTAEYIEENVQTIFINGVAADSLQQEMVDGTTVALSAAMPGLAGAIFRRQGVHGSLRSKQLSEVTHSTTEGGHLTLKFFNSIALDRVEDLLAGGIQISGKALGNFAATRAHLFEPPVVLRFKGEELSYSALMKMLPEIDLLEVRLKQ
ncbi:hypothetical protein JWJ90_22420 [Desulfobulbus rhabdoformis]|uniref:hypothetical protein n=1 Tax=Desulfobulbus rhabdoformis TaxID=34032 RepID=UPI001965B66B|nr:hypothetical protein [Desulfobulbus rhabdoformis]MBM9617018.1 hypothetical protein [Desulfobulbus rhabdoformis]